jgi:trehalose 6-phosphate synthase
VPVRPPLIVVSNRGPVTYARDSAGGRVEQRGGGGLASALRGLLGRQDVTWIASAMSDEDRAVAAEARAVVGESYRLRLLAHDPVAYDLYYNVVANPMLWFIQHGLWGLSGEPDTGPSFETAWRDGYAAVNRAFATAVIEELDRNPEAAVWFQDYHLYLAPRLVRDARPDATLAHFIHIPWPEASGWEVLPTELRLSLYDGVLANDVVGFHTHRWREAFERSALPHATRPVRLTAHPISVDPQELDALRESPAVAEEERLIEASRPELLVVGVDRTDPAKNVVLAIRAFGLLLERQPELRGRVRFLALLDPSRQRIPVYAEYRAAIEAEARAVNAAIADAVDLQIRDNFPQTVAAYRQYDVLFVDSVSDGLNLVAKEGPLVNARDGVLVLSESAGAHEELGEWAVTVSPLDVSGQADALYTALTMPGAERRRRAAALEAQVRHHDLARWIDAELSSFSDR